MSLPAWAVLPLAFALGLIAALGQEPYDLPVLTAFAVICVIALWQRPLTGWASARFGWVFGAGYFGLSLIWILEPFQVDAARHGWMAPFALVLLAGGLALFWGAAFGAARRWDGAGGLGLILFWPLAELLRAYVFTGFPWAMIPQAFVGTWFGQTLAWFGPHGVMVAFVALGVGAVWTAKRRWWMPGLVPFYAIVLSVPFAAAPATLTGHTVRLVQPNAAQHLKWDPDHIQGFYERLLQLTAKPAQHRSPDLVVLPETAIPWAIDLAGSALAEISAAAGGTPVVMGAIRRQDVRYFNAAVVLDETGQVTQRYDKHHLVPFGEYFPLGDLAARFGIHGLAAQEGRGYSAGPGAEVLDFGPLGKALPLICYEAVFAHDVTAAPERPAFLIQMTNDGWFGEAAGPLQHLAQARMRAIEQGLPMARSANTGVSAMIDPYGRVVASISMNQAGVLDSVLPAARGPTLYSRTGDLPVMLLLLMGLGGLIVQTRRRNVH